MKKFISIIVLTALLLHLIGFYAYFVVRQGQIRQEMRELIGSLSSEEFETFVFTEDEYRQIRVNDHEVKIKGMMYDHSTPKLEEGKVILFARHDEAEDNLISFINEVVNTASQDHKPIPSQILSFYTLIFLAEGKLELEIVTHPKENLFPQSIELLDRIEVILAPPPKV